MPAEMTRRARVEQAIREVSLLGPLLAAAFLGLSARGLAVGVTVGIAIMWALAAVLLTISMALAHTGRLLVLAPSPEPIPTDQVP